MFCIQCGKSIAQDARFCAYCGASQDAVEMGKSGSAEDVASSFELVSQDKVQDSVNVRPWIRFLARTFDMFVAFALSLAAFIFLFPEALEGPFFEDGSPLFTVAVFFGWVFVESILLSTVGTTPGKWLFNIFLIPPYGKVPDLSKSLSRSFMVWWRGLGNGFPIVSLVTQIVAYFKLKKHGQTSWDRDSGFSVVHARIGPLRIFLLVIFFISVLFATAFFGLLGESLKGDFDQASPGSALMNDFRVDFGYAEATKWFSEVGISKEIETYRKAAERGDAYAQFLLGKMYYDGIGVPQDVAEAVKWYRKAEEQGHARAVSSLVGMYALNRGERDMTIDEISDKIVEMLPKMSENNVQVDVERVEAARRYRKAAEQGGAVAQYFLAHSYANGEGVPKDDAEAMKWIRKAADQGFARAQVRLGGMYYKGQAVPKDYAEAMKLIRRAAEQGDAKGQFGLGLMYAKGDGVPQDHVQAHMWFNIAVSNGFDKARKGRDALAEEMTPQQIQQAQALASEWARKHQK